jgi:hypothetical protein
MNDEILRDRILGRISKICIDEDQNSLMGYAGTHDSIGDPMGVIGKVVDNCIKAGVSRRQMAALIRSVQADVLNRICIESDGCDDTSNGFVSGGWCDGKSGDVYMVDGLHEEFLMTDKFEYRSSKKVLVELGYDEKLENEKAAKEAKEFDDEFRRELEMLRKKQDDLTSR